MSHLRGETERQLDRLLGRDPEQCEAVSTDGYRCELVAGHYDYHQERSCNPLGAVRRWGTLGFEAGPVSTETHVTTTTEAAAERRGMERAVEMLREMAEFCAEFDGEPSQAAAGALRNAATMIEASASRVGAR